MKLSHRPVFRRHNDSEPRKGSRVRVAILNISKQSGRVLLEPGRCELTSITGLEALLQPNIPEPAFDGRQ